MNEIDIMEQNLARMLCQHQSTPNLVENQPSDPFQKRLFGRKTKRSHLSVLDDGHIKTSSLSKIEENFDDEHQHSTSLIKDKKSYENKIITSRYEADGQSLVYQKEIEKLINRLKKSLTTVEESYKNKVKEVCHEQKGENRQKVVQQLIGNLQGSIQFIIKDCFLIKDQKSEKRLKNIIHPSRSQRTKENQKQNCRISNNVNHYDSTKSSDKASSSKQSKSIYQSILQERKMKLSKKRMI